MLDIPLYQDTLDVPLYLHCYRILLIDALILLQLLSYVAFNAESGTEPSIGELKRLENCKWVPLGSPPVALVVALKTTQTPYGITGWTFMDMVCMWAAV